MNPTPSSPSTDEAPIRLFQKQLSFNTQPVLYVGVSSNVLVPEKTCCSTTFTLLPSNLPDGSYFLSTKDHQYLDIVFLEFPNPTLSFYSVQVVPYVRLTKGWFIEPVAKQPLTCQCFQVLDGRKIYLALSLGRSTIQGLFENAPSASRHLVFR